MQGDDMKKCTVLVATQLAATIVLASSNSPEAADESQFFLQNHGEVRVLRGLDPGKNFETAKLPVEIDVAPASAPEPQVEPRRTRSQVEPKRTFTRTAALRRARERGITVHRAGVRSVPRPEAGHTRREALERARRRGVAGNRSGV